MISDPDTWPKPYMDLLPHILPPIDWRARHEQVRDAAYVPLIPKPRPEHDDAEEA